MAVTIGRRDYTNRSFDSVKQKILEYIQARFPNASNDFFEDHFLMVVTELMSFTADQLHFYLDMQFNEVMWDSVGQRDNIVRLAKLLSYQPRGISSSQVELDCTTAAYVGTLSIYKGTKITASNGTEFEVQQDYTFNGPTAFTIDAIQGVTRVDEAYSNGTTDQVFQSQYGNVSSSVSPIVKVDGTPWTKVEFLYSATNENVYELYTVEDSRIRVIFGDGVHGNVPPASALIEIEYLTSDGADGNVTVGAISQDISGSVGGSPHTVTVVNNEASSGGDDEEGVEEIRVNAPIYFQSLGSLVTEVDFKGFAERYAGISKARVAVDANMKRTVIYVMGDGYTQTTQTLKDNLLAAMEPVRIMGLVYSIADVELPTVDVTATIYVLPNFSLGIVQDNVEAAVEEYFTPADPNLTERDIGEDLHFSDLDRTLDEVEGVKYVKLTKFARVPVAKLVTWSGDTYFDNLVLGETAKNETWTIEFSTSVPGQTSPPTKFRVVGSVSGLQTAIGTVDSPYTTDEGELAFVIRNGTPPDDDPNQIGDYATIRTSEYAGDVEVDDAEFCLEGTVQLTYRYAD